MKFAELNYEITIRNTKGKEEQFLMVEPSSIQEEEFFKLIFSGEVVAKKITNSNKIIIQPKPKEENDTPNT